MQSARSSSSVASVAPIPVNDPDRAEPTEVRRRRFLTYLVAAPVLTVAAKLGLDAGTAAPDALAQLPELPDGYDLGDALITAGAPSSFDLVIEVMTDDTIVLHLPRAEVGQGITTTTAMIVAEEMGARLNQLRVVLCDAEPRRGSGQLTGASNSVRSLWTPLRSVAAGARARLVTAAANRWALPATTLVTRDGTVVAPDGRNTTFGSLSAEAAAVTTPAVPGVPKPASQYILVGWPTNRIDARDLVTGAAKYTNDLAIPGALPTVVARPPTLGGTVRSVNNLTTVRAMQGVQAVTTIPSGVAVSATNFHQAFKARDALNITWNPGPGVGVSDAQVRSQLRAAIQPFTVPVVGSSVEAEFEFNYVNHAPMEVLVAVANVSGGRAEVWMPSKSPIVAADNIAAAIGLPASAVTVHVIRGGGSFGRRLFFDPGIEAARVSQAIGRPVKLMWSRNDDMRHGRFRPASYHKVRAAYNVSGQVTSFEHQVSCVYTDFDHGLGDALSQASVRHSSGRTSDTVFYLTQKVPYDFGVTSQTLAPEVTGLPVPTSSWRSVYSGMVSMTNEIIVDELAARLGQDPVTFRRNKLSSAPRALAVLNKVAYEGNWGRTMAAGTAQGVAIHEEYKSAVAHLVEVDTRVPAGEPPRVTKVVIAVDAGRAVNPRGLEAQMLGSFVDGQSVTFAASNHLDSGAIREGSFADFRWARMKHTPTQFAVYVMPANGDPGGAGELGLPSAAAACANAYARATRTSPRRFPIIDF